MQIVLINPNTTASFTARIGEAARAVAAPGTRITAVNPINLAIPSVSSTPFLGAVGGINF